MAEITETPVEHARDALDRYYRHGITQNAVDVDHDARELVADLGYLIERHARATIPGDDRGRELARALDDLARLVERIDTGTTTIDVSFATRLARARLDVARYVAAPPETEASTGSLLDAIGNAVYEAGVGRSGPDPTWHGVATAAERAARAWFARRAAPAETEATYAIEGRDATCPSCQAAVGTSLAYVLDEHTSSIEDGPGSENPPTLCGGSEVAVHHVLAATPPAPGEGQGATEGGDGPAFTVGQSWFREVLAAAQHTVDVSLAPDDIVALVASLEKRRVRAVREGDAIARSHEREAAKAIAWRQIVRDVAARVGVDIPPVGGSTAAQIEVVGMQLLDALAEPAPAETEAVVHDPTTEDEDGRCTEYPDLIDRHGARWVWAIGSEYRARHVLGGWKCRDGAYIRRVFGPVTEVPATAPAPEGEARSDDARTLPYWRSLADSWRSIAIAFGAPADAASQSFAEAMDSPTPAPAGPQAEGAGETSHDCSPAVAAELLRLARSYEKSRRDGNELVLPSTGLRRRAAELTSGAGDEAASGGGS